MDEVFRRFDRDGSQSVSREEFKEGFKSLGFTGEGTPALTEEEIDALISSADKDGDGLIDYYEFYDRLQLASLNIDGVSQISRMDFLVDDASDQKTRKVEKNYRYILLLI